MTSHTPVPFSSYEASLERPNVVVDGSPNDATVLCLTHWPGIDQPPGLAADLSAQMAYRYLEHGPWDHGAEVVTNNHFDQDGLVSVHVLARPEAAMTHSDLLIDVAAAGDFGTYRVRDAARASMIIAAYSDPERSPLADEITQAPSSEAVALLYEATLPLLVEMVTAPDRWRDLWADEDARLTQSEQAIADGRVTFTDRADLDLAIVRLDGPSLGAGGHRFTSRQLEEIHPFAVHNATDRHRILLVSDGGYRYVDRYESWVQYRSAPVLPRVDMRPLAVELCDREPSGALWVADPPADIMPTMRVEGSDLDPDAVIEAVVAHLSSAPTAWQPFPDERDGAPARA